MAHVITDSCVMCGTCCENCPVGAIREGDAQYFINPDECIDCGACASNCPSEAIFPEDELPAGKEQFAELNKKAF